MIITEWRFERDGLTITQESQQSCSAFSLINPKINRCTCTVNENKYCGGVKMMLILNGSGCVLIHEVLILINCLLMMVKWSDLVSGSGAGVARRPGPLARSRTDPGEVIMQTRSLPLLVLCSCRILSQVSLHPRPRDCVG